MGCGPLATKLPPPPVSADIEDDAFLIRLECAKAVLEVMVRVHRLSARETASISDWRPSLDLDLEGQITR